MNRSHATIEYQTYLGQRGIRMERIWNTDADELVCPVCVPLNNQGEDEWIQEFPLGPPAHVRCRCPCSLPSSQSSALSTSPLTGLLSVRVPLLERCAGSWGLSPPSSDFAAETRIRITSSENNHAPHRLYGLWLRHRHHIALAILIHRHRRVADFEQLPCTDDASL